MGFATCGRDHEPAFGWVDRLRSPQRILLLRAGELLDRIGVALTGIEDQRKVPLCPFNILIAQRRYIGVANYDTARCSIVELELNDGRQISGTVRNVCFF